MKNILVCFGGNSTEHEISIISAQTIVDNIDRKQYNIFKVYISVTNQWKYIEQDEIINIPNIYKSLDDVVLFNNGEHILLYNMTRNISISVIDIAFPVLHGKNGEDGAIQGLFNMLDLPYVGSSISGACLSMDKEIAKLLVERLNIPVTPYMVCRANCEVFRFEDITDSFGLPFIMKPCNCGSSIGVYKVYDKEKYHEVLDNIFSLDSKILIEKYLNIREIECGVIGNSKPFPSPVVGEVISEGDFYSFSAKYENKDNTIIEIPANILLDIAELIKKYSIQIYQRLECLGFARVDFFLTENNEIIFNELNAIPGFTNMSMFPLLWDQKYDSLQILISAIIEQGEILRNER